MSVEVYPSTQMWFRRPLTRHVEERMHLRNGNDEPVAYKLQTTSPKRYSVSPNFGRIEPYSEVQVKIILKPFEKEPPLGTQCQDKFRLKSVIVKPEWGSYQPCELWDVVEAKFKDAIYEHKTSCIYLPAAADKDNTEHVQKEPTFLPMPSTDNKDIPHSTFALFKSFMHLGSKR